MEEAIDIPEGVKVAVEWPKVVVEGPKGKVERIFKMPLVKAEVDGSRVLIKAEGEKKRHKKMVNTLKAHFRNLFDGVLKGYRYRLAIVHTHFPIRVSVKGNEVVIENFLGEKTPRKARILPGVTVKISGKEITVEGIDIEAVGQTAANIEQATRLKRRDRRVFKDGIYLVERGFADA